MSNHQRRRRHRRPTVNDFTLAELQIAASITSATRGCTCDPDITVTHRDGIPGLSIAHDDGCPAADTPSALVFKPKEHRNGA